MINFLEDVDGLSFIIFYGSQLGQAKSIAEGLVDVALEEYSLITKAFELNVIRNVVSSDEKIFLKIHTLTHQRPIPSLASFCLSSRLTWIS